MATCRLAGAMGDSREEFETWLQESGPKGKLRQGERLLASYRGRLVGYALTRIALTNERLLTFVRKRPLGRGWAPYPRWSFELSEMAEPTGHNASPGSGGGYISFGTTILNLEDERGDTLWPCEQIRAARAARLRERPLPG